MIKALKRILSKHHRVDTNLPYIKIGPMILDNISRHKGESKFQKEHPYLVLDDTTEETIKGEYCYVNNEITIYTNNIKGIQDFTRTMVHEYEHYLQSPTWLTRYYRMGYTYGNHPYELTATKAEDSWKVYL